MTRGSPHSPHVQAPDTLLKKLQHGHLVAPTKHVHAAETTSHLDYLPRTEHKIGGVEEGFGEPALQP